MRGKVVYFSPTLPSTRCHQGSGGDAGRHSDTAGNRVTADAWEARKDQWLPSEADRRYVKSLMTRPVFEPGKMANWIGAPKHGIKGRPVEFEYVKRSAE